MNTLLCYFRDIYLFTPIIPYCLHEGTLRIFVLPHFSDGYIETLVGLSYLKRPGASALGIS